MHGRMYVANTASGSQVSSDSLTTSNDITFTFTGTAIVPTTVNTIMIDEI